MTDTWYRESKALLGSVDGGEESVSGKTDALIIPAFLLLLPAAAAVGTARAAGSVLAAIQKQYREAKEAALEKERASEERRATAAKDRQDRAESLLRLVGQTDVSAEIQSLTQGVSTAKSSAKGTPSPASSGKGQGDEGKRLLDKIRALQRGVEESFPETGAWAETRKELEAKLGDLERLASSSPRAADQAVSVLERRIERELKEYTGSLAERPVPNEREAALLADMRAKLAVVCTHHEVPHLVERAKAMAKKVELASSGHQSASALNDLASSVDALISELCIQTAGEETSAIVGWHLKDVLLSMGYRVTETPPPSPPAHSALVAPISPGIGVEFSVGGGRMKTEVVSLSEQVETAGPGDEEKACALVEGVYRASAERRLSVQEGFRLPLQSGDRLRKAAFRGRKNPEDTGQRKNRHAVRANEAGRPSAPVA